MEKDEQQGRLEQAEAQVAALGQELLQANQKVTQLALELDQRVASRTADLSWRVAQQETVARLGQQAIAAGMDEEVVLAGAARDAARALEADYALVLLLTEEGGSLLPVVTWGFPMIAEMPCLVMPEDSVEAEALARGEAVVLGEEGIRRSSPVNGLPRLDHAQGGIVAPMGGPNEALGLIAVYTKGPREYGSDDVMFLHAVASVLAGLLARRKAEEMSKADLAELERSNADLQQFAYVASHDLQEPLRTVASFADLLGQRYEGQLDERADKYIRHITDGALRGMQLIEDLLTFSRVGTKGGKPKPVAFGEALRDAQDNLARALLDSGGQVEVAGKLPTIMADHSQLVQLLQNLIGNAIKFRGKRPLRILIRARSRGDRHEFSVRDNGIGIAQEHLERVFLIFKRLHTREAYPGSGIGLAICRKIVDRLGGKIWVEPCATGADFRFTLPAPGSGVSQSGLYSKVPG